MNKDQLKDGKLLPLMEEFYTVQGEGYHTGAAAYFIRIGGCDVGCYWCDSKLSWDAEAHPPVTTDKIIENASQHKAKAVVITGGEPSMYQLDYLTEQLHIRGIKTFIETSGAHKLTGRWNWICLSPKKQFPPKAEIYTRAHELKMIIQTNEDLEWAEENASLVSKDCHLFLQAEWSASNKMIPVIVEYVKAHPEWKISLQSHKYMNIP